VIDALLLQLDSLLLVLFGLGALTGAVLMLVLRQPMRVATALISTMVFLGGIYGLLGVHFIAAFQVLIYVGAVMVFMVYVIMLLEVREEAGGRYSNWLVPGTLAGVMLVGTLGISVWLRMTPPAAGAGSGRSLAGSGSDFGVARFSASFLRDYWLHFELTSVLLLAAVVAALAVIRVSRRKTEAAVHG
jgi:NADH-quinone oxidoreductase subunit J